MRSHCSFNPLPAVWHSKPGGLLPNIRPHSRPIGEMVHRSDLARRQETKEVRRRKRYVPRNLVAAPGSVRPDAAPVVGVDGEPIYFAGLYPGDGVQPTPS